MHAAPLAVTRVIAVFLLHNIPVLRNTPEYGLPLMGEYLDLVGYCYFYFALRQCDVHVPVRHKITNPLIPQQAGASPMPTGRHYQGLVLRYIERAASAANPCTRYQVRIITRSVLFLLLFSH